MDMVYITMISALHKQRLVERGLIDRKTAEEFAGDSPAFLRLLQNALKHEFIEYRNDFLVDGTENKIAGDNICYLLSLPVKIMVKQDSFDIMVACRCEALLHRLFDEGAQLDPEIFDDPPADTMSAISFFENWRKAQELTNGDYYLHPEFWEEHKSVKDIERLKPDDKASDRARHFSTTDNVWRQAARAGEFGRLLDIYLQEKKPFPMEILIEREPDETITLLELLLFRKEAGVFEKLLSPELWRGRIGAFETLWQGHFPETLKQAYPLDDILINLQSASARRTLQNRSHATLPRRRLNQI